MAQTRRGGQQVAGLGAMASKRWPGDLLSGRSSHTNHLHHTITPTLLITPYLSVYKVLVIIGHRTKVEDQGTLKRLASVQETMFNGWRGVVSLLNRQVAILAALV